MESSATPSSEDVKTVQQLAKGLLELYEPPLTTINTHLKELTEKQEAVQSMLTSERRRLEDLQNDAMLDALLADIATNKEKLVSISNSMMSLHKKVQSLSARAANVEKAARNKCNQSRGGKQSDCLPDEIFAALGVLPIRCLPSKILLTALLKNLVVALVCLTWLYITFMCILVDV